MRKILLCALILSVITYSCKDKQKKESEEIQIDKSINKRTSFNNLFIDSNFINSYLAKYPDFEKFRQQYSDFYKLRNYQCAWFDSSGMGVATNFAAR